MIALYDCTADDAEELSFQEGDIFVDVTQSNDKDWYEGRIENTNKRGLFPGNFVKRLPGLFGVESVNNKEPNKASTIVGSNGVLSDDAFSAALSTSSIKKESESAKKTSEIKPKDSVIPSANRKPSMSTIQKPVYTSTTPPIITPKPMSGSSSKADNTVRLSMKFSTPPPTFERPQLKSTELSQESPTRARSYSASSVKSATDNNTDKILRPSQLASGGKSELEMALSKGSPKVLPALRPNLSSKYGVSAGSGIQLVGLESPKVASLTQEEEEEEDEDGFQLIKPSQIRLQNLQTSNPITPKSAVPTPSTSYISKTTSSTEAGWKKPSEKKTANTNTFTKLENVPPPSNPMPRLPSRPNSAASRKSRNSKSSPLSSRTSSSTSLLPTSLNQSTSFLMKEEHQENNIPDKASLPPILKPKPQLSQPTLPPRPKKLRSVSNPPPLQPKPTFSSAEPSSVSPKKTPITTSPKTVSPQTPPRLGTKPSSAIYQQKLQSASKSISPPVSPPPPGKLSQQHNMFDNPAKEENVSEDANLRPSVLLNRARSATNPPYFGPKPTIDSIVHVPKLNNTKKLSSAGLPKSVLANTRVVEKSNSAESVEPKKKVAPPPPPSRPPKNDGKFVDSGAKARYEALFDTVEDDGYVDGETVFVIWMKSKLTKDELARVWKECDPDHRGLLDKNAFIHGMGKIDVILKKHQLG
ncbi:hypothetical protein CU098_013591 [Rhizopus stolonifer]|uniref:SH3 domain-containing protein n=1 Tax=Rhizopus stolonifer TaxID=4846 RepID=A0A367KVC5_RHIST|nr:hypothetical protein CU098_013591 [Rhizopus stolonifer]